MKSIRQATVVAIGTFLGAPCISHAESNVLLYGIIDTGVEYLTNALNTTHSLTQLQGGNIQGSRWGLKGAEDIGGGYQATFWLESGFDSTKGSLQQGGRLFGRQAAVGLKGNDNELWLGRVYNPMYDPVNSYDPTIFAQYSLASQDPGMVSRGDSAVRYMRTLGDFRVTAFYSFGYDGVATPVGGTASGASNAKDLAFAVNYTGPALGAVLAYDNLHGPLTSGGTGLSTLANGLIPKTSVAGDRARRYVAAASYKFGKTTLMAGYRLLRTDFTASSVNANLFWGGVREQFTPALAVLAGVYHTEVPGKDIKPTSTVISAEYFLSKSTYLYSNASYVLNSKNSTVGADINGVTLPGKNQLGLQLGLAHRF